MTSLVYLPFLGGEARQHVPLAIPRPVFVARPGRANSDAHADPNPGHATLLGWLYRTGYGEPTHATVRLASGALTHVAAAWVFPAQHLAALRIAPAQPMRRMA